jgi:hypothetical protein
LIQHRSRCIEPAVGKVARNVLIAKGMTKCNVSRNTLASQSLKVASK